MNLVSVNGVVMPAEAATVPWNDRAFQLGDGLFETMKVTGGNATFLDLHLDRLYASAQFLEIHLPGRETLEGWIRTLLRESTIDESALRLTVSRGIGGELSGIGVDSATVLINTRPLPTPPAGFAEEVAIARTTFVPPTIGRRLKGHGYQGAVLAQRALFVAGLREGIVLSSDGELMEGTVSNLFGVLGGAVRTASLDRGVLPGITRKRVLRAAEVVGVEVIEEPIRMAELRLTSELFYTNALRGITSITRIRNGIWESMSSLVADALRAQVALESGF